MRGGKREGAGRKAGVPNKVTRELREAAAGSGEMPVEYMLRVMRDPQVEHQRRDHMAIAASPYLHPKLSAIEHTGKDGGPIVTENASELEIARRLAFALMKGDRALSKE